MSNCLPGMLDSSIEKIREMVDVNTVVGQPMKISDDLTIIPVSTVSVGLCGGGADYVSKNENRQENPFGGGIGAGIKVTPVAFLIIKEGSVRMVPVATPANTTVDRLVEMLPETLDKIVDFIDSRIENKESQDTQEEN